MNKMKVNMKMQWVVMGMMVLTIFSCKPEEVQDVERPVINSVMVNSVQQETHELTAGNSFVVQV